jgi:hypothetical protein
MRPDPLHCEINAWQKKCNLVYIEAVQRKTFHKLINVLFAPVKSAIELDIIVDSVEESSNL